MNRFERSRKGIGPVTATAILVAVAITISVSVAYWMGGTSSEYITRLEEIEIHSIVADKGVAGNYTITLSVKNTGSADATIDSVRINDNPLSQFPGVTSSVGSGTLVFAGGSANVSISVPAGQGAPFNIGSTLEVLLHTAAGKDCPQMVKLP